MSLALTSETIKKMDPDLLLLAFSHTKKKKKQSALVAWNNPKHLHSQWATLTMRMISIELATLGFPRKYFFTFDDIEIPTKLKVNFVEISIFRFPKSRFRSKNLNFDLRFDIGISIPISTSEFRFRYKKFAFKT
jgi:hypothetical protein